MTASLWLVPREGILFVKEIQELITKTVPSNFPSDMKRYQFEPHVTLTSGIEPSKTYESSGSSPQEWLDKLTLPEFKKEHDEVNLELDQVEAGDTFFKKLFIRISDSDNLTKLAARCRLEAVVGSSSSSSSSSSNGTTNGDAATNGNDDEETAQTWAKKEYLPHMSLMYSDLSIKDVKAKIPLVELQIGWGLGSLFDCCGGTLSQGGNLVLVDTSKEVADWKVIASREVPWVMWKMSRNLA